MRIPLPPVLQPTNEMLTLIAAIDEFKGEWRAKGSLGTETLRSLRRIATIESAGSSTRIEGAKLSDSEVEKLVGNLGRESFQSRDEQEVAGYAYASYTSLESVIEHNKEAYYLALRRTQTSFREAVDWEPWILFFVRALKSQIGRLRGRLAEPTAVVATLGIPDDLSPLAGQVLKLLEARGTLSVGDAANALGANRHTLKDKFTELVQKGYAELHGKGRGAYYRRVKR